MPETHQTTLERTEARVAGGGLVITADGTPGPKIWRADMARLAAASFTLREADGKCVLSLQTPAGAEDIYAYDGRAGGTAALQAVTRALLSPQAQAAPGAQAGAGRRASGFWARFFKAALGLVGLIVCILALWVFAHLKRAELGETPPLRSMGAGVPVPADEMLGK